MKFNFSLPIALLFVAISFTSCEDGFEHTDVVRFDYTVNSSDTVIHLNDTVIRPYETEELSQYLDDRDQVKEFSINSVEVRFYGFTSNSPNNKITGHAKVIAQSGNEYKLKLFAVGDEFQDSETHAINNITHGNVSDTAAYDAMAQDMVASDSLILDMGHLVIKPDSLACSMSIYIHYTIKAESGDGED